MSATVLINENLTWMPTALFLTNLLPRLSSAVEPVDSNLTLFLRNASESFPCNFLDLQGLSIEQFRLLPPALEKVFSLELGLRRPDYVWDRQYLFSLSWFKALLRMDERVERDVNAEGRIIIREGVEWAAPTYLYDLTLEHFAAGLYGEDADFAHMLLQVRSLHGTRVFDLQAVDAVRFRYLLPTIRHMTHYYYYTNGNCSTGDISSLLNPLLNPLEKLLESDKRAK